MIVCPFCEHENIEGADTCEECQQPLGHLSNPKPATKIERNLVKEPLRTIHHGPAVSVPPDTPVAEVLQMLVDRSIGCMLIVEEGRLVGIFSERDALMRLGTESSEFGQQPISQFMTPDPETLDIDDKIAFALHKMDVGGYRHIPVLEQGGVAGVVSIRDILGYITEDLVASQA